MFGAPPPAMINETMADPGAERLQQSVLQNLSLDLALVQ